MSIDIEDAEDTGRQLVAAERLPPDLMLLKMENESIMAVARATPRDSKKIVRQLQELIDAYPEAADESIYVKPVGTEMRIECGCGKAYFVPYIGKDGVECPKCQSNQIKSSKKVKKFAEGLSIRAAESIRAIYGYNRLSVTMEESPNGNVKISGVFVDYATGTMTADTRVVSPFYTDRFKKTARHPDDRFYNVLVKAEKSKLRRDIVLDSVPNSIKAAYRDACEKKLETLISPDKIKAEILPNFAKKGLTLEHLEKILGRPMAMGWTEQERVRLRQIWTALQNEETTVADLLSDLDDQQPEAEQRKPSGPVSTGDLTNPQQGKDSGKSRKPKPVIPPVAEIIAAINRESDPAKLKAMYDLYCGPDSTLTDQAAIDAIGDAYFGRLEAINAIGGKGDLFPKNRQEGM